ncbi:MAG: hypothetical protein UV20_C0049G0009 [Candidatus Magasanikbacteria bacterium GW2011_GWA2_42_32]|uniref:Uncharacterized protein n=1 Tax=Candidatus Magasanikbacteria bacterium GW2011_GWA2_42_32 TaxID=1619039 RepID=A0A0G0ZY21_9BACT|nr:MAG: hypothetical protein UV20_C0049G0009 [Candidatus Magasanikbacteria bacterium GW2011_GWA2_42_32]
MAVQKHKLAKNISHMKCRLTARAKDCQKIAKSHKKTKDKLRPKEKELRMSFPT